MYPTHSQVREIVCDELVPVNDKLDAVTEQLGTIEETLDTFDEKLDSVEEEIKSVDGQFEGVKEELAIVNEKLDKLICFSYKVSPYACFVILMINHHSEPGLQLRVWVWKGTKLPDYPFSWAR